MATWHQLHARPQPRLYHDTLWTVLTDPPNDCRSSMLFATKAEAEAYIERLRIHHPHDAAHSVVLRPACE